MVLQILDLSVYPVLWIEEMMPHKCICGWLGWAMVLGSFQCRGVLLLLHIVGQGPAVLAAGAGRVGYIFYSFHLSSLSNVLTFGRRLNMTEILWFRLLNPKVLSVTAEGVLA